MPTDQPSGSSQMLRVGLPSTFMAGSHNAVRGGGKAEEMRGSRTCSSSPPKSRDPYAVRYREDTEYGSLLSQGRPRRPASAERLDARDGAAQDQGVDVARA